MLTLVNPSYTSQIDPRTGLLQGRHRGDRFYCRDAVVLDADTNAACNIRARLQGNECMLWSPLSGGERLARGANQDYGGDCPPRTRVVGTCNPIPINRERSPRAGTGMYQVKEQR